MKVFSIGMNTSPQFSGEKMKKNLRNTAGAAAIALATALPAEKADAQYYYPIPQTHLHGYYQPAPVSYIPDCFIYGDINNFDYNKTLEQTFDEIDSKGNGNGVLTMNEVVAAERDNWNATHLKPFDVYQREKTAQSFNLLSNLYNEDESSAKSINIREYKKIMQSYMEARNVNNLFNLLRMLTIPRIVCPPHHHHHPTPQPNPPQHRPRHRH